MSFWDKVKKSLAEVRTATVKGASEIAEKAAEATQIAKLKVEINNWNNKTKEAFAELGGRVYELHNTGGDIAGDRDVGELVNRIKSYEEKIKNLEEELEKVSEAKKK
ncbi:MAG: hypothetical protein ACUVXI_07780 [bacterium]